MIWVYEGLTAYLGRVLTARSGLWTKQEFREALALTAAAMDHRRGREWRPLIDTAIAAPILYRAPLTAWSNWRRRTDFYQEGVLIWLSVDTKIRTLSHGKRSLDDFAKLFYGMDNGSYATQTYTFEDLVAALNKVQPYDWAKFLRMRLDRTQRGAPLAGITRGGWKLVYTDKPSNYQKAYRSVNRLIYAFYGNMLFRIGLSLDKNGKVYDVLWNGPAFKAGIGPGMQLIAVNDRKFSQKALENAIAAARKSKAPIHLLVENQKTYKTYDVDYHGGLEYPHLVREQGKHDYLDQILEPLAVSHR
jgi:predicted metalloprotease with PDZ domain